MCVARWVCVSTTLCSVSSVDLMLRGLYDVNIWWKKNYIPLSSLFFYLLKCLWLGKGWLSEEATGVAALKVGMEIMCVVSSKPSVIVQKQQESRGKERLKMRSRVWESWWPRISPVSPLTPLFSPNPSILHVHVFLQWPLKQQFSLQLEGYAFKSMATSTHKYKYFSVNIDF